MQSLTEITCFQGDWLESLSLTGEFLYASISQYATGDMVLKTHLTKESELLQPAPKYSQWEIRCFFTTELTPFPTNTLGGSFQASLATAAMGRLGR